MPKGKEGAGAAVWAAIRTARRTARRVEAQCWCGVRVEREPSEIARTGRSACCRAHSRLPAP